MDTQVSEPIRLADSIAEILDDLHDERARTALRALQEPVVPDQRAA